MKKNIILSADSYKYGMPFQYPPGTEYVFSYIESRGGPWDATVFFGLQGFIRDYLMEPITQEMIDEADELITAHGEPFYREGWEYILSEYQGRLPVVIRSVDEGSVVPVGNILVSIQNTDAKCWWLTTFLETSLLKAVWYPTTVCTNSYECKKIIKGYLEKTSDDLSGLPFKLHDFSYRGNSSEESAQIGSAAHLVNFMGTDTIAGLRWLREHYSAPMAGFSVVAAEHSTITSWGKEHEVDAYRNMIQRFAKPGSIVACVSDSYNIFEACKIWGTQLKDEVIASGATIVIRPDSGEPSDVVLKCLRILDQYFGHTVNSKGFKVLNNVRVLQGDGIAHDTIHSILAVMFMAKYSADNIAMGMGGALAQQVNRDTCKFAMKASSCFIDGTWRDVFKDPITDQGKRSKKGRIILVKRDEKYETIRVEDVLDTDEFMMHIRFVDGQMINETTLEEIRTRAQ